MKKDKSKTKQPDGKKPAAQLPPGTAAVLKKLNEDIERRRAGGAALTEQEAEALRQYLDDLAAQQAGNATKAG